MSSDKVLLNAALALAKDGKPVFPCSPKDKRPLTHAGFKDATLDLKLIRSWWTTFPEGLIGMPTGKISGITVVDVDIGKRKSDDPAKKAEGEAAFEWWEENEDKYAKASLIRTKSGGLHLYCKYKPGDVNTQGGIHKGVDRRGEGGYVIVPPSPGYEIKRTMPEVGWPIAPGNTAGSGGGDSGGGGTLEMHRVGMNWVDMTLNQKAETALAETLHDLLIEPDRYHHNLQRQAFAMAFWFGMGPMKVKTFLAVILQVAKHADKIDAALYSKHIKKIRRIAVFYGTKAEKNQEPELMWKMQAHRIEQTKQMIEQADTLDLEDLESLIEKRRGELDHGKT